MLLEGPGGRTDELILPGEGVAPAPALEAPSVRIAASTHPFRADEADLFLPEGATISEIVALVQPDSILRAHAHVFIGGWHVPRENWHRVKPRPGHLVTVKIVPQGGGGSKDPLRTILTIGVLVAAAAFGPALLGTSLISGGLSLGLTFGQGIAATSLLGSAVIVGAGMLLVDMIAPIRPPQLEPSGNENQSPSYFLDRARNTFRPYAPVPVVFGRHKMVPALGAEVVTEALGDTNHLRLLVAWGYGPLRVSNIQIGETPISNFEDVEIETRQGRTGDAAITIYPKDINQQNFSIALSNSASAAGGTAVDKSLTTPRNVRRALTNSSMGGARYTFTWQPPAQWGPGAESTRQYRLRVGGTEKETPTRQTSYTTWVQSSAPSFAVRAETSEGVSAWVSASSRTGSSSSPDASAEGPGAWVTRRSAANANELSIDVAFPRGLVEFSDKGKKDDSSVIFQAEYRRVGDTTWSSVVEATGRVSSLPEEAFDSTTDSITVTGRRAQALRYGIRWRVEKEGQYDVRLRRVTVEPKDDPDEPTRAFNAIFWSALRTISDESPIDFPAPLAVTALNIRATDQLSGGVEQLNGIVEAEILDYNSATKKWVRTYSSNPASCFRAALQHPARRCPVPDAMVDLETLEAWHKFCNDNGYEYNHILDVRKSVWEILSDICAVGRASPYRRNGRWSVLFDDGKQMLRQHFTPINSSGFEMRRAYDPPPHGVKLTFSNREKGWMRDERIVYDDGYTDANAVNVPQINLVGITDPEHVYKFGRFHLAQVLLRRERWTFLAPFEYLAARRGSRVSVQHDVLVVGVAAARVAEVLSDGIRLDVPILLERVANYGVKIRTRDNAHFTVPIKEAAVRGKENSYQVLTFKRPVSQAIHVGDLVSIGEAGFEVTDGLITSVTPQNELTARLTLVPFQKGVYQAETGDIPDFNSGIAPSRKSGLALTIVRVISDESMVRVIGNVREAGLRIEVLPIADVTAVIQCELRSANTGEAYKAAEERIQSSESIEIGGVEFGGQYDIRARWVAPGKQPGPWSYRLGHVIVAGPPPPPIAFDVAVGVAGVGWRNYTFMPPPVADFAGVQIRWASSSSLAWASMETVAEGLITESPFLSFTPPEAGTFHFEARSVDTDGNVSSTGTRVSKELTAITSGVDGRDGASREWIFRATTTGTAPALPKTSDANKKVNDFVPSGWSDGFVKGNVTWIADRTKALGAAAWSEFSTPKQFNGTGVRSMVRNADTGVVTVTYTDGTTDTFTVPNPKSISSITRSNAGRVTVTFTDGSTAKFTIPDGAAGNGIDSISRNLTTGVVTVTYDDGSKDTFALEDGNAGPSGAGREWIYRATTTSARPATPSSSSANRRRNDYVPSGWNDDPVSGTYVWVSSRSKKEGSSVWSGFSTPVPFRGPKGDVADLTDGSVTTAKIALSATSDLYSAYWSGNTALSSSWATVASVSVPNGAGFKFIAQGVVLVSTSGNQENTGIRVRLRRGATTLREIRVGDGTDRSINYCVPVVSSGSNAGSGSSTISLQATEVTSGSASRRAVTLMVFLAKR